MSSPTPHAPPVVEKSQVARVVPQTSAPSPPALDVKPDPKIPAPKKPFRIGLRARFILVIFTITTVFFAFIAYINIRTNINVLRSNQLHNVTGFAILATKPIGDTYVTYKDSGKIKIDEKLSKLLELNLNIRQIAIIDADGHVLYQRNTGSKVSVTKFPHNNQETIIIYNDDKSLQQLVYPYAEDSGLFRYSVVYEVSNSEINQALRDMARNTALFSLLGLFGALVLVYILIDQFFLRPIARVTNMAIAISLGQYTRTIHLDRSDEIGDLSDAVDRMASTLKANIAQLQQTDKLKSEFMMLVSHNLRTPLAIIAGYIDLIKRDKLEPKTEKLINSISAASQHLSLLAEEILTVSQIEAGQKQAIVKEPIDISELIRKLGDEMKPSMESKQLTLVVQVDDHVVALVSPVHFRAALSNLLDNAMKFTQAGHVSLSLRRLYNVAEIEVADTGIGIAPEEVSKLFTKFHRATDTQVYDYPGSGLGLYLTKQIIEVFGGTIMAQSELGKGSTFRITVPIINQSIDETVGKAPSPPPVPTTEDYLPAPAPTPTPPPTPPAM